MAQSPGSTSPPRGSRRSGSPRSRALRQCPPDTVASCRLRLRGSIRTGPSGWRRSEAAGRSDPSRTLKAMLRRGLAERERGRRGTPAPPVPCSRGRLKIPPAALSGLPARTRQATVAGGGMRSGSESAVSGRRRSAGGVCRIVCRCVGGGGSRRSLRVRSATHAERLRLRGGQGGAAAAEAGPGTSQGRRRGRRADGRGEFRADHRDPDPRLRDVRRLPLPGPGVRGRCGRTEGRSSGRRAESRGGPGAERSGRAAAFRSGPAEPGDADHSESMDSHI